MGDMMRLVLLLFFGLTILNTIYVFILTYRTNRWNRELFGLARPLVDIVKKIMDDAVKVTDETEDDDE